MLSFIPILKGGGISCGTYDLESVSDDADSHELLSVVAAVHHQGVGETLNDWALGLSESLDSISSGGVGDVDGLADLDVIAKTVGGKINAQKSAHLYDQANENQFEQSMALRFHHPLFFALFSVVDTPHSHP